MGRTLGVGVGRGVTTGVIVGVAGRVSESGRGSGRWCRSRCPAWAMIKNHVRAERAILGARRGWVDCANVPIDGWPGIHRPKRSTDGCRITTARSDQEIAVRQPEHESVGCPVAIKISPEDYVSRRIDRLHWVA